MCRVERLESLGTRIRECGTVYFRERLSCARTQKGPPVGWHIGPGSGHGQGQPAHVESAFLQSGVRGGAPRDFLALLSSFKRFSTGLTSHLIVHEQPQKSEHTCTKKINYFRKTTKD